MCPLLTVISYPHRLLLDRSKQRTSSVFSTWRCMATPCLQWETGLGQQDGLQPRSSLEHQSTVCFFIKLSRGWPRPTSAQQDWLSRRRDKTCKQRGWKRRGTGLTYLYPLLPLLIHWCCQQSVAFDIILQFSVSPAEIKNCPSGSVREGEICWNQAKSGV